MAASSKRHDLAAPGRTDETRADRPQQAISRREPRTLLAPHVLLGVLVFALSAGYLLGARPERRSAPEIVLEQPEAPAVEPTAVTLVLPEGPDRLLERTRTLSLPPGEQARWQAIYEALADALRARGSWPEGLPTPEVFVVSGETLGQPRNPPIVVLDFVTTSATNEGGTERSAEGGAGVAADVRTERELLAALDATARANGASGVRILRDDEPPSSFLGHLDAPTSLEGP